MSTLVIYIFLDFYGERKELDSTQIANHNADIAAVVETISTMINPFDTDLEDLVNITSGEVARPDVKKDLLSASIIGEDKLDNFIKQKVTPEESEEPDLFSSIESTKLKSFSRKNVPVKAQTNTCSTEPLTIMGERIKILNCVVFFRNFSSNERTSCDIFSCRSFFGRPKKWCFRVTSSFRDHGHEVHLKQNGQTV